MSTAATRAPERILSRPPVGRRAGTRRSLAVPLSVTVLRSGVPDSVPGRSVDVSEGGIGAILAGELFPGELVGVEFQLPKTGQVLAKARVCYQDRLRCGLQFLAIAPEQKEWIESWTHEGRPAIAAPPRPPAVALPVEPSFPAPNPAFRSHTTAPELKVASDRRYIRRKVLMLLIASVIVVAGMGWWRWEEGWRELESKLPSHTTASESQATVAADVMMRRLIHRVDPVTPDAFASSRTRRQIVLDAVIGSDGSVVSLRPQGGPDILARAAMDAVQWWKFQPYEQDGQRVQVATTLTVDFR
jgi:outer membrane biosynthesis protein TonB